MMKKEEIRIRQLSKDDLTFLNEVRNLFAEEFLHDSRTFTIQETNDWFEKTNPNYYIILKNEEKAGYFRLSNHSKQNKNIYIGADVHPKFWGQGIAYKSYVIFMDYLFENSELNKISLEVLSTNKRAIHLYKKLGFMEEGVKRQEVLKKDTFVDSIVMSVLKSEWYGK